MLITFKTLQQKTFKIEIEDSEKVKVLKEKIAAERGDEFPVEGQKLIYAGKILDDDKDISEYNIDPVKNFVVVMAVKPKAKPAPEKPKDTEQSTSQTSTSSTSTTPSTAETTTTTTFSTAAASETTAETSSTETVTTTEGTTVTAESALLTGSALESSVTELMSLGYSREQVMRALNSSYHNADRAAEYLLSGNIPDIGDDEPTEEDINATPASGGTPVAVPPTIGGTGSAAGDLQFLRSLPQFQLMRNQVQAHPETLPTLLQEIGRSNPQLLQLISQNQEAFIALLNEPSTGGSESGGGGGGVDAGERAPGGGFQIQVTAEEKATIDRIASMGFQESEVIQAYFACDKNEQLAIEFLLNS